MKLPLYRVFLFIAWVHFASCTTPCKDSCLREWCTALKDPATNKAISAAAVDPEILAVLEEREKTFQETCAHAWCPALHIPCSNRWLQKAVQDPELLTTEATSEATTTPQETESSKKQEPPKKEPGKEEGEGHDVSHASHYGNAGFYLGCKDAKGRRYADGKGCVLYYYGDTSDQHTTRLRSCIVGKCKDGRCIHDGGANCGIY
ncbi:uncharacterized protein LOC142576553 isoform X1 [Dermacentor variabilis]|uniref:uncharacterized protein LOC142576553 isoform X1 n=1 Tax=Dermacentor variabilis TaxID=34621 RepID=UPI003F5BF62C